MYITIFVFSVIWALLNVFFRIRFGFPFISKKCWEESYNTSKDYGFFTEWTIAAILFLSVFLIIMLVPTLWLGIAAYSPAICTVLLSIYPPKIDVKAKLRKWLLDE
jgi:hypothetical protein